MSDTPETTTPATAAGASDVAAIDVVEPDPKRWFARGVIALAQLMVILDASIVNIALPHAQAALPGPCGVGE